MFFDKLSDRRIFACRVLYRGAGMKGTIRAWVGDAIGALCLFVLMYALLWVPYVFAPCDPATEQCQTGEKP